MRAGIVRFAIGIVAAVPLLVAPTAGAATTVGQTFLPDENCISEVFALQTGSPGNVYTVPSAGVLTSWSFQAGATAPSLKLKVGRAVGPNLFTIVGESTAQTPPANTTSTFDTQIPVQAGDVIGWTALTAGLCGHTDPAYSAVAAPSVDPAPGSNQAVTPAPGAQLDISAKLEPDADNDGFGDETQDACPSDASKQLECVPPETTIDKAPKKRSTKRKVKIKFSSNETGSTFTCTLDKKPAKPCSTPFKAKVKPGKHKFSVVATDPAGNVDATPAKAKFRVNEKS